MAEVTLTIGGRAHVIACRPGEEPQFETLGRRIDAYSAAAARAAGGSSGERAMLFVALMLADALQDAERAAAKDEGGRDAVLDDLARRLEALADRLEKGGPSA